MVSSQETLHRHPSSVLLLAWRPQVRTVSSVCCKHTYMYGLCLWLHVRRTPLVLQVGVGVPGARCCPEWVPQPGRKDWSIPSVSALPVAWPIYLFRANLCRCKLSILLFLSNQVPPVFAEVLSLSMFPSWAIWLYAKGVQVYVDKYCFHSRRAYSKVGLFKLQVPEESNPKWLRQINTGKASPEWNSTHTEKQQTTKCNKPDTRKYVLCDSVYVKF